VLSAAVMAAAMAHGDPARAELTARADIGPSLLVDAAGDHALAGAGGGGTLALGYSWDFYPVLLIHEIGGSFRGFDDQYSRIMAHGFAGVRIGAALSVEPSLALHLGYGYAHGELAGGALTQHGLTFDTELRLDFRLERWLTVGPTVRHELMLARGDTRRGDVHVVSASGGAALWW